MVIGVVNKLFQKITSIKPLPKFGRASKVKASHRTAAMPYIGGFLAMMTG
ncbi:MAG: hypothetical protein ACI8YB_001135, partial [Patiriisocius sp.]